MARVYLGSMHGVSVSVFVVCVVKYYTYTTSCTRNLQQVHNKSATNPAGVKRELLDTVKARKLAYYGHTMRKQGSCLEKEIIQRNSTRCTQARKATHGLDGQHQDVDRTLCGRVNQNDRGQG